MSEVTEETIEGLLMRYLMGDKRHIYVLPNSNQFFAWEADVISVTASHLCHEFEVKISLADYRRDAQKHKHRLMKDGRGPSYFWYVTHAMEIEPPENAGWINIYLDKHARWIFDERKQAQQLHKNKIEEKKLLDVGRLLSWRIANLYGRKQIGQQSTEFDGVLCGDFTDCEVAK